MIAGSYPVRDRRFICYKLPKSSLGATQLPIQWLPLTLSPAAKLSGRDANHSPLPSVEDTNEWSYNSTPLYAFMVRKGTTFTILSLGQDSQHSILTSLLYIFMMQIKYFYPDNSHTQTASKYAMNPNLGDNIYGKIRLHSKCKIITRNFALCNHN
jgi:hypothetical protein